MFEPEKLWNQAGDTAVVGLAVNWRSLVFGKWTDSAGQTRADRFLGLGMGMIVARVHLGNSGIGSPGGDRLELQIVQGRQQNVAPSGNAGSLD